MKPFYCFKFDENTGTWTRYEIREYRVLKPGIRKEYQFSEPKVTSQPRYFVEERKFDRFVSDKVFSFNDDIEAAKRIAIDTVLSKISQAESQVDKMQKILSKMIGTLE